MATPNELKNRARGYGDRWVIMRTAVQGCGTNWDLVSTFRESERPKAIEELERLRREDREEFNGKEGWCYFIADAGEIIT